MDLVTITDCQSLGMNNVTVRITSIEEGDGGVLAVEAEEFPTGIASAVAYPVQGGFGSQNVIGLNVVPAPVNTPLIFEPPPALTAGDAEVWVRLSPAASRLSISSPRTARPAIIRRNGPGRPAPLGR